MSSIWERLGERVGYGLAAVVLGPAVAMARRERRMLRSALNAWCDEVDATRLVSPDTIKRMATLAVDASSFSLEITLDVLGKRATIDVSVGTLPARAASTFAKDAPRINGIFVKYRMTPSLRQRLKPLAEVRGIRVDSQTLDAKTAEELVREVAESAIGKLDAFILTIAPERIVLEIVAPTSHAEWDDITHALVVFCDACLRRWGTSYR